MKRQFKSDKNTRNCNRSEKEPTTAAANNDGK